MTESPGQFAPATARRGLRRGIATILVFGAAIALGLLAISRTEVGAAAVFDLWGRARPALLVAAFASMTLAFLFMGLRWRALMPARVHPPAGGLMAIVCAGLLLNYALPGPVGELGAAWFASRRYGLALATALASGVAARMVGLATAAVAAAVVWVLVDLPVPPEHQRMVGAAVLTIGAGGALLAALTIRPDPWKALAHRVLDPLTRRPGRLGARASSLLASFDRTADGLAEVTQARPRAWLQAVGWSAASHASVVTGVFLACLAFGAQADPAGLVFTYATTTATAFLLFVLPGSQLGWDAIFLGLLVGSAGLDLADAAAVALTVRVHHLGVMVLGALALAWLLREPRGPVQAAEASPSD